MSKFFPGLLALLLLFASWGAGSTPGNSSVAHWIMHPGEPGADLPPVGRSLFDQLFASTGSGKLTYQIPYPFAVLRASLAAGVEPIHSGALLQVLIPKGRSLHREAAAPDYFKSPRLVLAVEAQPLTLPREAGLSLTRNFMSPIKNAPSSSRSSVITTPLVVLNFK